MRNDTILKHVIGPDVLDVGCAGHEIKPKSPYWLHGRLREKFPHVTGIDLNEAHIHSLRRMGYDDLFVANAEDFKLKNQFDTIVAGELIEHLTNPGRFLSRCLVHLKPSGRVVISTPYVFSLLYVLYALFKFPHTCQNTDHTMWFGPQTLSELARRSGFHISHWELIEDYEFDNPSFVYRLFINFVTTAGRVILPKRLRNNNLLFILTPLDRAQKNQ